MLYIINFLTSLIFSKFNTHCAHDKISPEVETAYCPDCGKLIHNEWYITRCSSCGVKMKAMIRNGHVVTQNHYCTNCGSHEYQVEKLEHINFIDINFAALLQKEVEEVRTACTTTCWEEKRHEQPKLLIQYL